MSDERYRVEDAHDLHNWFFLCLGALVAASVADKNPRGIWVRSMTLRLMPAMSAAIGCAMQNPDRFRALMGGPIELEEMPE